MPDWLLPGNPPAPFDTPERCRITEILNDPACPQVSLARAEVAAGVTTRLHALTDTVECYILLAGEGVVEVNGTKAAVRPGDRVVIPAGAAQRITNTGRDTLVFDCLCTPRFLQKNYVDLET